MLKVMVGHWRLRVRFPNSVIYPDVVVDDDSVLGEFSVLFPRVSLLGSQLGAYSYVQADSVMYNVNVGKFCSIASKVTIGLGAHPMHMVSTSPVFYDNSQPLPRFLRDQRVFTDSIPRTLIGSDVWIGQGAMVKAGLEIGTGAVVGAGAVVTKDVPPYTVVAGNPGKKIRLRFSGDIVNRLLDSKWWTLSDIKLKEYAHLFVDPIKLLEELDRVKE